MTLKGRVAWVTGGGRGVGRAVAVELAARGALVLVTGRSERSLGETVGEIVYQGGTARHLVSDVRDPLAGEAAARRAVEQWGQLDVVVACAAIGGPLDLTADDVAPAVDVIVTNLVGTLHTFRAAARVMTGPGRLVAVGSELAHRGAPGHAAYTASKAGLEGLVASLGRELAGRQIAVNAVSFGRVEPWSRQQPGVEARAGEPTGALLDATDVARFVASVADPGGGAAVGTGQVVRMGDRVG